MKRALAWLWDRGVVGTFLAGLFALLPLVITFAILGWLGGKVQDLLGPDTLVGEALHKVGLYFASDPRVATVLGWCVGLAGIWLFGLLVKATAKYKAAGAFQGLLNRLPVVRSVYGPVAQVVSLMQRKDAGDLQGMSVVYCAFGQQQGGGFLGLLASGQTYRFDGQDCRVVYIPSSPMPMGGGLVFVPAAAVRPLDMGVDELMQIYLSVGVMAPKAVPPKYRVPAGTN